MRSYLHPFRDLSRVNASCAAGGEPYLTLWITNHSTSSMAYKVKYEFLDKSGVAIGSAEGVFSLAPDQVLGDQRLFGTKGRCSTMTRLASLDAYPLAEGEGQPSFPE
ncbi:MULTISPECIES: hypothetical protein [unclassified Streptomyces]|uniref:hypothetical protein n=1 Tax=unclassified Streptomyces TaxID=2593676 RepID=UPI0035DB5E1B